MISFGLAQQLHEAGLRWTPSEGDRFVLPDRDLDGRVFTISEMVVEVRRSPVGDLIAFNGTTEWALDAIEQAETVWLPREAQLRELVGAALLSLARLDDGWRCTVRIGGELLEVEETAADEAYGRALLAVLEGSGGA
jgi:hypothetical protein